MRPKKHSAFKTQIQESLDTIYRFQKTITNIFTRINSLSPQAFSNQQRLFVIEQFNIHTFIHIVTLIHWHSVFIRNTFVHPASASHCHPKGMRFRLGIRICLVWLNWNFQLPNPSSAVIFNEIEFIISGFFQRIWWWPSLLVTVSWPCTNATR